MKKIFGYVFKDWKISDYIICATAVVLMFALLIVSKEIKKPAEVKEIFSVAHVICAVLLVWGVVFCSKDTVHGYVIGLGTLVFFSYYLFVGDCFGSFIAVMFAIAYVIFRLVLKCLKKDLCFGEFERWDYLFLFGGLAICSFPIYMLLDTLYPSFLITEILVLLAMLAFLFLSFKNVKYAKFAALAMAILTAVSLVMLVVQLQLANAGLILGLVMIIVFEIIECIKMFLKKKEVKQD